MKNEINIIALDGPAASGKSTLGERLANYLGFVYLDTGVMYRAVTLAVLKQNVDVEDETSVVQVAEKMDLDFCPPSCSDGRSNDVILEGEDVTWQIRKPEVEAYVSLVSTYPGVRNAMTMQQRKIASKGGIVMVGRDIGTVVLPNADLKIYLDASVEVRAERRYNELIHRNQNPDFDFILSDLKRRDEIDSTRTVAPLKPASDAIIIDSNKMDAEQVFQNLVDIIKTRKLN
ncbi:MAG: cytidylate kinase [Anaerolineaceae bacterium]|nr:cytidylate kinase [Anaerolineaceae bacterium]